MKRIAIVTTIFIGIILHLQGQAPQKFSYQAVLRNADGTVISNQNVDIKISLRKAATDGLIVYSEVHNVQINNGLGLVSLSIGDGTEQSASFTTIPWGETIFIQVDVKKAGQSDYQTMGTSQILSVPYALYAASGLQGEQGLQGNPGVDGVSLKWLGTLTAAPISPSLNQAYYNSTDKKSWVYNGTSWNILAQDGTDGLNGSQGNPGTNGISIGWLGTLTTAPVSPSLNQAYYNSTDKKSWVYNGTSWNILAQDGVKGSVGPLVSGIAGQTLTHNDTAWIATSAITVSNQNVGIGTAPDISRLVVQSATVVADDDPIFVVKNKEGKIVFGVYQKGVRVYVDDSQIKGAKGGFAVGGLTNQGKKSTIPDILYVDADSTRLYFREATSKGAKGGFAVGGLTNQSKVGEVSRDRLLINTDSTRFYVNGDLTGQLNGGFAITGLSGTPTANMNFFKVTKDSTMFSNNIYTQGNIVSTGSISTGGGIASTPLTDIDGNVYKTVKIGTQTWMQENLRATHYSYGKSIFPYDTTYNYTTNVDTIKAFGRLYSYFAVTDTSNVCPNGWHVPLPPDWDSLLVFVGGPYWKRDSILTGLRLMEQGTPPLSYWNMPNNANNASGFSGRPGGQAMPSTQWIFSGIGTEANWWGKFGTVLKLDSGGGVTVSSGNPSNAFSVRCVKGKAMVTK